MFSPLFEKLSIRRGMSVIISSKISVLKRKELKKFVFDLV